MPRERILFVTGRLAEPALRQVLERLGPQAGFEYEVCVLGISVAALMHAEWVRRKLVVPAGIDRVMLPGWCQGDVAALGRDLAKPVALGPKDLQDLPDHFGRQAATPPDLSRFDIEIVAEINHAPRLDDAELMRQARSLADDGADVIDLGCIPGETWPRAGEATRRLRAEALRVSIDSFDQREVEAAVAAGAELVLSCNRTNLHWAASLPAELVAIPDDPQDLASLEPTVARLQECGARFRIDPVLEPIGFGFAASLGRYLEVRRRWPTAEILMGVGNLTELTEVDSAGVNLMLAGFCQETGIRSVLTTQVVNWCKTAVREFDIARRLTWHAQARRVLPKHVDSRLVMLRAPRVRELSGAALEQLARQIKDPNFRVFAAGGELHLINRDGHWHGRDPFALFAALPSVTPAHAFYLGYELSKALTALTLGKNYSQDEPLDWGFLTAPESGTGGHGPPASAPGGP